LKPDVVFFGEDIPGGALQAGYRLASGCRTMLVVGTSAEVAPASQLPWIAKRRGATIIEVNLEPTCLTSGVTDLFLRGSAATVLSRLAEEVLRRLT
jgi:NAD-dependent deacetylase